MLVETSLVKDVICNATVIFFLLCRIKIMGIQNFNDTNDDDDVDGGNDYNPLNQYETTKCVLFYSTSPIIYSDCVLEI